ncbi:Amine oxidase [Macleaya cordata]|uniref:Amine oxidase n=1 Tax=Macleaya cordata TaxID=56857 RepID=A0A200R5M1_MACCD|nr:Amine oxidase [Macleaya cordata]
MTDQTPSIPNRLQTIPQIFPSLSQPNPNLNPSPPISIANPNPIYVSNPNWVANQNPSPIPNPNSIITPNPSIVPNPNLFANSNSNLNPPLSLPFPRKRRRGRAPRKTPSLPINSQVFLPPHLSNGNFNGNKELVPSSSSSSSPFIKSNVENSSSLQPTTASSTSDISEEIIFINKEATAEALIALSSGFPADSLTEEEIEAGVVSVVGGIEQVNYTLIRNHILTKWRENVSNWLTKESLAGSIPPHGSTLLNLAYNFLVSHGYVNFGVAPAIKEKIQVEATKQNVIIIGAGLAGLAAARQLMTFGFKVVILEGRKRAGGRVYTKKMEGSNKTAAADLGGSVLTGTLGNPLGIIARQLSCSLHKVRDKCPLYSPDGKPVDPDMDSKVENAFNRLLDKASRLRQLMGEVSVDVSLGSALETFREVYGDAVNAEEMNLFNWHLANLEYANAGLLSKLSLAFWDQDDPYDMGGDHCFLPGGNGRLVQALTENLPILYEKTVHTIRYGNDGVQVIAGSQVFEGDMALCTVPLGVLKSGSIKFIPELPQRKLDGIKRLGFGLLNKVAMLFPHVFWGTELDTFGHLSDETSRRGEFFLFYSYATVAGGPILIALVAGEAAHKFENMPPTDAVTRVIQILKGIYEPQGIEVPEPIQTVCTRWGSDPFSLGSYSNVAVGASGDDYDILAENAGDGRLFFAGEATTRRYPATMHGAFLSGLREAANMAHHANARALRIKVERSPSKNSQSCAALLADLFREPDLEFGSFSVILARKSSDPKSTAILRVTFSGPRKKSNEGSKPDQQHSNKLLFQQLQSHYNQQQQLHVYTLLSRQHALELSEVRGGDEMRLHYLSEKLGMKLVGRRGLGSAADSVIASIKAERGIRRSTSTFLALKSGTIKQTAAAISKQTIVRRAKAVSNGSNSTPRLGSSASPSALHPAPAAPPSAPRPTTAALSPAPRPTTAALSPAPRPTTATLSPAPRPTSATPPPAPHPAFATPPTSASHPSAAPPPAFATLPASASPPSAPPPASAAPPS